MSDDMVRRLVAGDRRALARAISLVEDGSGHGSGDELVRACKVGAQRSLRIGITGSPGVGKSTLADALIRTLRAEGARVGVLAVDPTSPFTGGALLGDRIRMQGFAGDTDVYIRSMATRGEAGGVAKAVESAVVLLEAAGFGSVVIETVGVGQDEVAVSRLVDATLLVLVPGLGDDVQSMKAGVIETAEIFVVNKADLPGADRVEAEILAMQSVASTMEGWVAPVVRVSAISGEGVAGLLAEVRRLAAWKSKNVVSVLPKMDALTLDHLGIAVKSIVEARRFYEVLGMHVTHEETVAHEQVKTAMLPLGSSRIELLEALTEDSVVGRFVAKRGEGLHHVALKVDRLDERFAALQAAGIRLASDAIRVGAGGHRYFFVHPASTGGVLLELVSE